MTFFWAPLICLILAPILWVIGLRKFAVLAGVVGLGLLYEALTRPVGVGGV